MLFTPAAQASQVEVKQTASQNAAAVGTGNTVYQDLDQGSYQNQLEYPSSGLPSQSENPNCKSPIKLSKMLLVQAIPFSKTLTKATFRLLGA